MDKNLVSINIITRNRSILLTKAIQSALLQTYQPIEIIIIDNNSNDDTEKIVKDLQIKNPNIKYFLSPKEFSLTQARNLCLSKSSGKYIAVLDDDDYWIDNDKIKKQVEFLEKNKQHSVVGTGYVTVDENDNEIISNSKLGQNETEDEKIRDKFLIKNQFTHSSVLIRKSSLDEIGGYVEDFKIWEDYATFLVIGKNYKLANLKENMLAYKKHNSNVSLYNKKVNLIILAKIIFRNRKNYPHFIKALFLVGLRIIAVIFRQR